MFFWHVEDLSWEISCVNVKKNIIVNFIIQKLKSKHISLKKYTNWAMLSHVTQNLEFSCETRKWGPKIHNVKKIGDGRIIRKILHGSGFLLVPNYKVLVDQSKIFRKLNKQHSPISIQIFRIGCLFQLLIFFDQPKTRRTLRAENPIYIGSYE